MNDNGINDKIRMSLLQYAPAFLVGALLIGVVLLAIGTSSPVAAQADTTSPTVSSIAITSDPDDDIDEDVPYWTDGGMYHFRPSGIYGIGDDIEVTVTFDEDVTVSGSPKLDLKIGRLTKTADYSKVEGAAVVFSYTVAEGDSDTDGVAIDANKLKLNGGSIRDGAGNDADLTHDALAAQATHEVDGIRPRMSLEILSTSYGADGFHSAGELIMVQVNSLASDKDPAYPGVTSYAPGSGVPGLPQLTLDFDGEKRVAEWTDGNLGQMFWYEVQEGDLDTDGVAIKANSISLNGGFLKDQAGNDAILTHAAVSASSSAIVDAVLPSVSSMAITSDPGEDNTYGAGDRVEVTVTFDESITVPNVYRDTRGIVRPRLELDIGGEAKTADYQSHRGTDVVFAYSVQAGDSDEDGISIGTNKLYLNGGVIYDAAGNNPVSATLNVSGLLLDAVVSHDALADNSGHMVAASSSPLTLTGPTTIHYEENGDTHVGSSYSVSGSNADITWSLSGEDGSLFSLKDSIRRWDPGKVLWFSSPPNYEDPEDADEDNEYRVTIDASDGTNSVSFKVVVVVTNEFLDSDEVPVIIGTPQVGETLTADVSRISGPDDFNEGTFAYVWIRIDGATETWIDGAGYSTYTLTADDKGKRIKVFAMVLMGYSFTDYEDSKRHSEPTAVVREPGQTNNPASGQPTITGSARVGFTLAADTSGVSDDDGLDNATFSYQWLADDADISGATSSTYTLVATDGGKAVKVSVSFTDDAGYDETLTSAATAAVAGVATDPPPAPTNLAVSDNGNGTLTLSWDAPDDDSVTGYQILRRRPNEGEKTLLVYVADTGSTDTTWTDEDVTVGTRHVYRVKANNAVGLSQVSSHAGATPASPPENIAATGAPTITGTARAGETLTAGTSGISDGNGLENATFSYQWLADDAEISGATSSTYTLAAADEGKAVKVRVSFTDDAGHDETLTSAATSAVAAPQPDLASVSVVGINTASGIYTGRTFRLNAGVRNVGAGASASTTLRYYQSTDSTIDSSDTEVGTYDVAALAAGESDNETSELTAPDTSGTYYYGACVDAVTDESNTTNNCSTGLEVNVLRWNSPATGAATITGKAQVGKTLRADISGISDDNGLDNAAFSYQWLADDAEMSSATSSTYTLAAADEGKAVKVKVSFTDDAGYAETLTSTATAAVVAATPPSEPPAKPVGLSLDTESGSLSVSVDWDDVAGAADYLVRWRPHGPGQKLNDGVRTTASAARITVADYGKWVVRVEACNAAGCGPQSTRQVVVEPQPNRAPVVNEDSEQHAAFVDAGWAPRGIYVSKVYEGIFSDPDGDTLAYSVSVPEDRSELVDTVYIQEETQRVFIRLDAEGDWGAVNPALADPLVTTVTLTATDPGGMSVSVAGEFRTLWQANRSATGAPSITGTARVGETLTAGTSGISDADGLDSATFSYQWVADDADISGATSSTYTLAAADEGKAVKVKVSFTDDEGNDESLTSEATTAVAAALPPPAPTNLVVSDNGNGTLTLTWDAPDDDSVTGYQILRRRPNEGEKTLLVYVADTGNTETTWTDEDVTIGTRHVYRVKAINDAGLSGVSNFDRATPTQ